MALFISSINSGSNGNCYYIGNHQEAVLIDAGISCREIERRMLRSGLKIETVKAIFISHEHSDHIKGLEVLSKKRNIPVYITPNTLRNSSLSINSPLHFRCSEQIKIGGLTVTPFSKLHDAADPYSFCVEYNGVKIGIFTDIGAVCDKLTYHFKGCHAAFLEANYDDEMLAGSPYPYFLKRRISGGNGHLSNKQALELFNTHRSPALHHVFLSHLSKNNNDPYLVEQLFKTHAGNVQVNVASRDQESAVYHITEMGSNQHVATSVMPDLSFPLAV